MVDFIFPNIVDFLLCGLSNQRYNCFNGIVESESFGFFKGSSLSKHLIGFYVENLLLARSANRLGSSTLGVSKKLSFLMKTKCAWNCAWMSETVNKISQHKKSTISVHSRETEKREITWLKHAFWSGSY